MTLSQAWQAFKDAMYAFWIYREPEPFDYVRDTDELTSGTYSVKFHYHPCPYYNDECPICIKK